MTEFQIIDSTIDNFDKNMMCSFNVQKCYISASMQFCTTSTFILNCKNVTSAYKLMQCTILHTAGKIPVFDNCKNCQISSNVEDIKFEDCKNIEVTRLKN